MNQYLAGFTISIVLSVFLSILCKRFNILLDHPSERKEHSKPVPLVGGLVLFAFVIYLKSSYGFSDLKRELALYIVFGIGLIDDLIELPYYTKLVLQSIAGLLFVSTSHFIFTNNFGLDNLLTFLLFVALLNAFNLIDGINGLLVGVAIIYFAFKLDFVYLPVLFVLLFFNIFDRLFMGDSGAFLIAYLLISHQNTTRDLTKAIVFFGYPMYEIASSFLRRLVLGKNPFKPDRFHLHHIGTLLFGDVFFLIIAYSLTLGFVLLSTKKFGLFIYLGISFLIFFFQLWFIRNNRFINSNGVSKGDEGNLEL
ncbi:UDP-GlcNAc:undecaprenyl-phosphate GlcNAc-1-phosphate transferase [Fervidobacterium changbaicum]|nr:UDP-GlcNAc:undecaprenyl-phosphate GlcNAc-1-phosphate transferase [Fervidobacterium changbaicum]